MKKLFLMLGVVALLASCTIEGVDSTVQILDVDSILVINQDSVI